MAPQFPLPRFRGLMVPLFVIAATCLRVAPSAAFCRVTTCNREDPACGKDAQGCVIDGVAVRWRVPELRVVVDEQGSALRGISAQDAALAVEAAASAWSNALCAGSEPASSAIRGVSIAAARAGFNGAGANTNAISFHDSAWPHQRNAVAKTWLTYDLDTGEILDADIELNAQDHEFALDPADGEVDLTAVLTHELGHVLGLDHSSVPGATMQPETMGFGTSTLRHLEPDDIDGLCAAYPQNTEAETPPAASSSSCSATPGAPEGTPAPALVALGALFFAARRGRERRR